MSEENLRQHPRHDPRQLDPKTMTTFLRRGALGSKAVFLGVGIALVAVSAGDPMKVVLIAIGCTLISYSGSLLVGWGALRNYGALYELVSALHELVAEMRAQEQRSYLDLLSRIAELRNGIVEILETETLDAVTRQLGEIRDMLQPMDEVGEQRRHGG
jgi:hypothetical protein